MYKCVQVKEDEGERYIRCWSVVAYPESKVVSYPAVGRATK